MVDTDKLFCFHLCNTSLNLMVVTELTEELNLFKQILLWNYMLLFQNQVNSSDKKMNNFVNVDANIEGK